MVSDKKNNLKMDIDNIYTIKIGDLYDYINQNDGSLKF